MRPYRIYFLVSAILVSGLIAFAAAPAAPAVAAGSSTTVTHPRPLSPDQPGNFALINYPTRTTVPRCLGISSSRNAGIWNCTYANDQEWHLGQEYGTTGFYQLINAKGQCLGLEGGKTAEGTQVVGWTCYPTHQDQYWGCDNTGTAGNFWFFNYAAPYVLGTQGGNLGNGVNVVIWHWQQNKVNNQVWIYYFISD